MGSAVPVGRGDDGIRTRDKGFADLCLTTWLRRHDRWAGGCGHTILLSARLHRLRRLSAASPFPGIAFIGDVPRGEADDFRWTQKLNGDSRAKSSAPGASLLLRGTSRLAYRYIPNVNFPAGFTRARARAAEATGTDDARAPLHRLRQPENCGGRLSCGGLSL